MPRRRRGTDPTRSLEMNSAHCLMSLRSLCGIGNPAPHGETTAVKAGEDVVLSGEVPIVARHSRAPLRPWSLTGPRCPRANSQPLWSARDVCCPEDHTPDADLI